MELLPAIVITCTTLVLAIVGFVTVVRATVVSLSKGSHRGFCHACHRAVEFRYKHCKLCGAEDDRPRQRKLQAFRDTLREIADFYRAGVISYEAYEKMASRYETRAKHILDLIGSRRETLAAYKRIPEEVEEEEEEIEEPPEVVIPEPVLLPPPEKKPEPVPEPEPEPEQPPPVVVEPESRILVFLREKWIEVLQKTFFFSGAFAAIAGEIVALSAHGGTYHPWIFMIFPALTLGIFGASILAKRFFQYPWTALALSVLAAANLPINYHAAHAFGLIRIDNPALEWGVVLVLCAAAYAGGARIAKERTLLFLAILTAPTGAEFILYSHHVRPGYMGLCLALFAVACLAHRGQPVYTLAAYVLAGASAILFVPFLWLTANLLDVSITGWYLAGLALIGGLSLRRPPIQYATASLFTVASILALVHFSTGRFNGSFSVMLIGYALTAGAFVLERLGRKDHARPLGEMAIGVASLALLLLWGETPPFRQDPEHVTYSLYLGAILTGIYFTLKTWRSRNPVYLSIAFIPAYALLALVSRSLAWPEDCLWWIILGLGIVPTVVAPLRQEETRWRVAAGVGRMLVPTAAAGAAFGGLILDRPHLYALVAIPVAGVHGLIDGTAFRREWQMWSAALLLGMAPVYLAVFREMPWEGMPAAFGIGAALIFIITRRLSALRGDPFAEPFEATGRGYASVTFFVASGAFLEFIFRPTAPFSPLSIALGAALAGVLHLVWTHRYSNGWHWGMLGGCLILLGCVLAEVLGGTRHWLALVPAIFILVTAHIARTGWGEAIQPSLRWWVYALTPVLLVAYIPLICGASILPGPSFPVLTAAVTAIAFAILRLPRPFYILLALGLVFLETLRTSATPYTLRLAAYAPPLALIGAIQGAAGGRRWGRAAMEVATVGAALLTLLVTGYLIGGAIPLDNAGTAFLFSCSAIILVAIVGEKEGERPELTGFIILWGSMALLGSHLCYCHHAQLPAPKIGILLAPLALAYFLGAAGCERRSFGVIHRFLYAAGGICVAVSLGHAFGADRETFSLFFIYAAVFGLGIYLVRREVFFYTAAFSFALGFLFLMRYLGQPALAVAMWEVALGIAYVVLGKVFFPKRSWSTNPMWHVALVVGVLSASAFIVSGQAVMERPEEMQKAIWTSLMLSGLFGLMGRLSKVRAFYALGVLAAFSAYYLTLRYYHAAATEWYTAPPAALLAGLGVQALRGKERILPRDLPPRGIIVIGLLLLFVPALVKSLMTTGWREGIVILVSSFIVVGASMMVRVKTVFWGGIAAFWVNVIVQAFLRIPFEKIPREIWLIGAGILFMSAGIFLEGRFRARFKEGVAEARGRIDRIFSDWI